MYFQIYHSDVRQRYVGKHLSCVSFPQGGSCCWSYGLEWHMPRTAADHSREDEFSLITGWGSASHCFCHLSVNMTSIFTMTVLDFMWLGKANSIRKLKTSPSFSALSICGTFWTVGYCSVFLSLGIAVNSKQLLRTFILFPNPLKWNLWTLQPSTPPSLFHWQLPVGILCLYLSAFCLQMISHTCIIWALLSNHRNLKCCLFFFLLFLSLSIISF